MLAAIAATAIIIRIVAVRDTRDVVEIDDRFVPIPGTGDLRACDRCGRTHEVHVDVLLSDGRTSTLGAGCARGESAEVQSKIKGAVSAAKTRTKLLGQLAALRAQAAAYNAIAAAVELLPLPEISGPGPGLTERQTEWTMGDVRVFSFDGLSAERRQALANSWRSRRIVERGAPAQVYSHTIRDLEDRIAKIERKLATFTAVPA